MPGVSMARIDGFRFAGARFGIDRVALSDGTFYKRILMTGDGRRMRSGIVSTISKLIINTIPGVAWSARPDGTADFLNQTYLDYTGLTAEEGMDWGWTAAVHPDDLNGLLAEWQRATSAGESGEA